MEQNNNKKENVFLVNFRGMMLPMTPEKYKEFVESLSEWDN